MESAVNFVVPQNVVKLYNDKITLSKFQIPKVRFEYFDMHYKLDKETGELYEWTWYDAKRRARSFISSLRRTHRTLQELSKKNPFSWFLTVTFNRKYVNRASALCVHKKFKSIIKRLKYRFGEISYISVPEFHLDHENIHYHVMINFERTPRTCFRGYSKRGYKIYHFHKNEKLKHKDCFMTLEKLTAGNNLGYLVKYMTKDCEYPLSRKFSATRNLKRSRLVDKVYLAMPFTYMENIGKENDFKVVFKAERSATYEYTNISDPSQAGAPAPVADLFSKDIKDEKFNTLSDFFYDFIVKLKRENEFRHDMNEIDSGHYWKMTPKVKKVKLCNKVVYGQLSFVAQKSGIKIDDYRNPDWATEIRTSKLLAYDESYNDVF